MPRTPYIIKYNQRTTSPHVPTHRAHRLRALHTPAFGPMRPMCCGVYSKKSSPKYQIVPPAFSGVLPPHTPLHTRPTLSFLRSSGIRARPAFVSIYKAVQSGWTRNRACLLRLAHVVPRSSHKAAVHAPHGHSAHCLLVARGPPWARTVELPSYLTAMAYRPRLMLHARELSGPQAQ